MSEFTSEFWDVFVAVVTVVSIVACAVFLKAQTTTRAAGGQPDTTGHQWDEDLAEYNNPLPAWWRWLFYGTIAFGLAYLVLYPGLGSWKGTLGWSQVSQYEQETAAAARRFAPMYDRFAQMPVEQLARNREAMAIGQKLFLNNCAQCHASDAGGSRGFPSLADRDWLWGGDVKQIEASIADGRVGTMPPFGAALGPQATRDVVHYVMTLSGFPADSLRRARGEEVFKSSCAACHGADARGNAALGAPNLSDRIWLHGSSEAAILETVTKGRVNAMPAHRNLLDAARIRLLAAYVWSLSAPPEQ